MIDPKILNPRCLFLNVDVMTWGVVKMYEDSSRCGMWVGVQGCTQGPPEVLRKRAGGRQLALRI